MISTAPAGRPGASARPLPEEYDIREEILKLDANGVENLAVCGSPGPATKPRKGRKKSNTAIARVSRWVVDHQIGISLAFFSILGIAHRFLPSLKPETEKFLYLSYYNPRSGKYGLGWDDMYFVTYWIMAFTGVRVAFMEYIAAPLAKSANIKGRKDQIRFAEQAWIFLYYTGSFAIGMYIMYHSDYWLDIDAVWNNWPDRETDGLMKWYYLVEFGFWIQQIVVVNIEERRKDHWQMFTHHIVTCSLMASSYTYHHTKVGNLILTLMDTVDFVLALAKMLKYTGFQFACDCAFGVFIVGWFVTRHILYNMVIWSVYTKVPQMPGFGCHYGSNENLKSHVDAPAGLSFLFDPFIRSDGYLCMTMPMLRTFLGLLIFLQGLLLLWFATIMRLAWKVIAGGESADDPRSDEEDVSEETAEEMEKALPKKVNGVTSSPVLEEEVGVEQMHFRSKPVTRSKNGGTATGVQLPVRKEFLNRVGCDTKTTKQ